MATTFYINDGLGGVIDARILRVGKERVKEKNRLA